ncbi:MAG TPA: T9SS type A sorting domain-containing protein [Puia sp.]|nr:T9SS type A sorting domain-containing protein [Puia sp.]
MEHAYPKWSSLFEYKHVKQLWSSDLSSLLLYKLITTVSIFVLCCITNTIDAQTGYIYVHLKHINEESSPDYSFTLKNSSGTTINTFSLNDQATADNVALSGNNLYVYDMGLSHGAGGDGQLWVVAGSTWRNPNPPTGTTGTIYYRNSGSANWLSTGITGAKYIDGAYANQFVYINSSDNVVFYNNGATNTIYSGGDARDVTANGGTIAISTSTHVIRVYSNTYTSSTAPATGGTWSTLNVGASVNLRIDMNLAGNTIAFIPVNSNTIQTVTTGGTVTSLGTAGNSAASYPDLAYDDNDIIYALTYSTALAGSQIYNYNGSVWTLENLGRNMSSLTAGAAHQAYGVNVSITTNIFETIYARATDNAGNIYWIDDERVKNNSSLNGNGIIIPVSPGTYTLTETLPSSTYDLGRYNIYDPGGSSSGNVNTNTMTFVVTAGEIVYGEYVNEKLNPHALTLCATQYIQTFDATTSSPVYTTTFGSGTYGTNVEGTAMHFNNTGTPVDGYYMVTQTATLSNWFSNTGLSDHTGNGGYYMLINAAYQKDEFYRQRITNLVPGLTYTLSLYAANASSAATVLPNITYGLQDTLGNVVNSTTTGNITSGSWTQFSFTFTATTSRADLFLTNNSLGGNGNDLAIDDISLTLVSTTAIASTVTNSTCSTTGSIAVTLPTGSSYEYSIDGTTFQSSPSFTNLSPGIYTVYARIVSTTCTASQKDTVLADVCGNVYDDANGLTDNTVSGTGTNASNNMYVNMVDAGSNKVVSSVLVNADGSYSLNGIAGSSYNIILTSSLQTIGSLLAVSSLPSGWISVGEKFGTGTGSDGTADGILSVGTVNSNVANVNFGVDQLPVSNDKTFANFNSAYLTDIQSNGNPTISGYKGIAADNSAFSSYYSTLGSMTGNDGEDCSSTSSCNTNSNFSVESISATTKLYYNNIAVTAGNILSNFNPALLSIYGQKAQSNISFTYKLKDAAGQKSTTAATWSLTTFFTLSLQIESFTATTINNQSVMLNWKTSANQIADDYEIWRSNDAQTWSDVGKVAGSNNLSTDQNYSFMDNAPFSGGNYYKLKIFGDGKSTESNVVAADINPAFSSNKTWLGPNPTSDYLYVSNMNDIAQINIYDMNGKLVISEPTNSALNKVLNISSLSAGLYVISLTNNRNSITSRAKFIKIKN